MVFVEARFQKAIADQAYLLFSIDDHRGESLEPLAVRGVFASAYHRLTDARGLRVPGFNLNHPPNETAAGIQVQLFLESEFPLTTVERDEVKVFFRHIRQTLAGQARVSEGNDAA